jgi:hypothetical protein
MVTACAMPGANARRRVRLMSKVSQAAKVRDNVSVAEILRDCRDDSTTNRIPHQSGER